MITHLSLFSGIGGLDLAAEWAGFKTVGQCEWADYPTKVLEKHWPDVPRWRDIRTLTGESFYERTGLRTVDVISGGFPCQPFSVAGKRRGKEDDRFLWPEMVRVIKELRPTWVVGENVAGIVNMALDDVLSDLETEGYQTRAFLIPAAAVGARHRRYRVAIVGYSEHNGLYAAEIPGCTEKTGRGQQERKETPSQFAGTGEPGDGCDVEGTKNMENAGCIRRGKPGDVCEQPRRAESERSGEALANTKSQHEGRLPIRAQQKQPGSGGSSADVADSPSKGEWGLSVQQGKSWKENPDTERSSKDVQHPNCAGCEEQHPSEEPDQQRFPYRRCTEGTICNATSQGLQDRAGEPLGRPEPEQEPKRSGGAAGEWTAQSGLGGMVNGISGRLDRGFLIEHYWDIEPDIPRITTGIKDRVGRLKSLGNAVVPQQFYPVFKAIADVEKGQKNET